MKKKLLAVMVGFHLHISSYTSLGYAEESESADVTSSINGLRRESGVSTTVQPDSSPFLSFVEVLFYLGIIIALIWLLVRWLSRKKWSAQSGRRIHVMGGVGFGPNKSVQVVKVGDYVYVLGVGDNVQLLDKWDHPEQIERFEEDEQNYLTNSNVDQAVGSWLRFGKNILQKLKKDRRSKRNSADHSSEGPINQSSFQTMVSERMQQIPRRKKAIEDWLREEDTQDWTDRK